MGKKKGTTSTPGKQQQYDNAIKSLFEEREGQMLAHFLPGSVYQETLTIEVMRTPLRVDRVYKVSYQGKEHIVHLEFETGSDPRMASRLLDYHTYFLHKYQMSVISILIYPFHTTIATSPFEEMGSDGKPILTFHFIVLPLWEEKAQDYLEKHAIEMYSFLPTMEGANLALLSEAIAQMIEWYKNDQPRLARELRWMGIMLRRATIVPLEDKQILERRLSMYDDLMEKDPKMQKLFAEREARAEAIGIARGEAKGEAKGIAKGEAKGIAKGEARGIAKGEARGIAKGEAKGETQATRMLIVEMVQTHYPSLVELAQQRVGKMNGITNLYMLFRQINLAHNEQEVRALLTSSLI